MKPLRRVICTKELHFLSVRGEFLLGDARELMPSLVKSHGGKIDLIYLDPPYMTGEKFYLSSSDKSFSKVAYTDKLTKEEYLKLMREVLSACHELLSDSGSIYLHVDYRVCAHMRLLLDDIFGVSNFMNDLVWAYNSGGRSTRHYSRKHDSILFYRKSNSVYFDIEAVAEKRGPARRNHMKKFEDESGRVCYSIRSGGKLYIYHEDMPSYPCDVWSDIPHLNQKDPERVGYATQKPEALLKRIILASSKEGALVADFFSGSATTAATALKHNRRFIALDSSPYALYSIRKRLVNSYPDAGLNEPFLIEHGQSAACDDVIAELKRTDEGFECVISYPDELIYSALGDIENGVFITRFFEYSSTKSLKTRLEGKKPTALYIMDAQGNHGFFKFYTDPQ